MVDITERPGSGWRIVLQPNRSISWHGTIVFYLILAAVSFTVAGGLAVLGYWLVLPFAGLEMIALAAALYAAARYCWQREVISVDSEGIRIERGHRRPGEPLDLPRLWSRAELECPSHPWRPSRLLIRGGGSEVEVGRFLNEEERVRLAESLRRVLATC